MYNFYKPQRGKESVCLLILSIAFLLFFFFFNLFVLRKSIILISDCPGNRCIDQGVLELTELNAFSLECLD